MAGKTSQSVSISDEELRKLMFETCQCVEALAAVQKLINAMLSNPWGAVLAHEAEELNPHKLRIICPLCAGSGQKLTSCGQSLMSQMWKLNRVSSGADEPKKEGAP